jgi:hypothetical protein
MRCRLWLGLAAVLAVAALIYLAMQPLFAFQALAAAGESGDRDRLAGLVDFPAVRADLKQQLAERIQTAIDKDKGLANSPFGALGALIGPTVVDQVVDAAVTPDGVAAILRSGHAPLTDLTARKSALPPPPETAAPALPATLAPAKTKTRFAYTGLDSFKATTTAKDGAELGWVMGREGLTWRLVRIELPPAT